MNFRQAIANRGVIVAVLVLQVIPLLLFPYEVFSPTTQEWWLPALLVVMALIASAELILRRSDKLWPWYLISFAHGFNIISRIMMIWPKATIGSGDNATVNWGYLSLTFVSILLSALMLWYSEQAKVRIGLLRR